MNGACCEQGMLANIWGDCPPSTLRAEGGGWPAPRDGEAGAMLALLISAISDWRSEARTPGAGMNGGAPWRITCEAAGTLITSGRAVSAARAPIGAGAATAVAANRLAPRQRTIGPTGLPIPAFPSFCARRRSHLGMNIRRCSLSAAGKRHQQGGSAGVARHAGPVVLAGPAVAGAVPFDV